jgi:hypothetical protein
MGFVVKGERFVTWRKGDDESRDGVSSLYLFPQSTQKHKHTAQTAHSLIAHPRSTVPSIMLIVSEWTS